MSRFFSEHLSWAQRGWQMMTAGWMENRFSKVDAIVSGVIVLFGLIPRIVHLAYPMQYDEAYTFMAFARPSLYTAITDYHLPNNHVLHTILVHLATRALGESPWVVRLPAFLAGAACIPLVYALALRQTNRQVAVISAALAAAWPRLIDYSADARGYSLVMCFSLGLFLLGDSLLHEDSRLNWALLVGMACAGAYTVPVMLYPLAVLYLWLGFSMLAGVTKAAYPRKVFLQRLVVSALCAAALTIALYSPILVVSGAKSLFSNPYVRSLAWADYWPRMPGWLDTIWGEWHWQMPNGVGVAAALLALAGTALHQRVSRVKIPVQLAVLVLIPPTILIQRPELNPRPWLFLIPLMLIWAGSGLVGLAHLARRSWAQGLAVALAIGLALWIGNTKLARDWPYEAGLKDRLELTGAYLAAHWQDGDLLLVGFPTDPQVWYYLTRYGVASPTLKYKGGGVTRVWAVVDGVTGQSLQQILENRDTLPACKTPQEMRLVQELDGVSIYLCNP